MKVVVNKKFYKLFIAKFKSMKAAVELLIQDKTVFRRGEKTGSNISTSSCAILLCHITHACDLNCTGRNDTGMSGVVVSGRFCPLLPQTFKGLDLYFRRQSPDIPISKS